MRDFVHVADVARANLIAIDAVADRPAESWATYNVCSGTPIPILRVAEYGDTTSVLRLPLAPVAYLMAAMLVVTALIHVMLILVPHAEDDGKSIV